MGSSLSRIQAIIYDRDFPRFPRPGHELMIVVNDFVLLECTIEF